MKFFWDEIKNAENFAKHGIWFEEAIEIFKSDWKIEFDDEHSTLEEERFLARAPLKPFGPIVVVYTEIFEDGYRIISARKE